MTRKPKKLELSRESVRKLSSHELADVHGGATANTCYRSCLRSLCFCG